MQILDHYIYHVVVSEKLFVLLYTEVSSFQGVGIEGFHCIQSLHFREEYPTIYRGVYRGVYLISGCWNRGVPLYTEVSSFQGVGIEEFHCIQRCPHFRQLVKNFYSVHYDCETCYLSYRASFLPLWSSSRTTLPS